MAKTAVWFLTLLLMGIVAFAADSQAAKSSQSWKQLANNIAARRCTESCRGRIEDYPSLVHLGVSHFVKFVCRGSILNERWVLTAAHCVSDRSASILVIAGSTICRGGPRGELRHADFHVAHPKYQLIPYGDDPQTDFARYDVGLVHLSEPLGFTNKIKPVRFLPMNRDLPETTDVTLLGCGCTLYGSSRIVSSETLTPLLMVTVGFEACSDMARNVGKTIDGTMVCAGTTGVSACSGDSGGPLYTGEGEAQEQVGVASWVLAEGVSGRVENVTVFADLRNPDILDWINQTSNNPINKDWSQGNLARNGTVDISG